ncbi:hypothetical protein BY996DRAFT_6414036 [Phakopsora pachyrhizi]|nr:hypothetical protein BY996DRAFT_6414036 [Phakopsora pachyrhizi]
MEVSGTVTVYTYGVPTLPMVPGLISGYVEMDKVPSFTALRSLGPGEELGCGAIATVEAVRNVPGIAAVALVAFLVAFMSMVIRFPLNRLRLSDSDKEEGVGPN